MIKNKYHKQFRLVPQEQGCQIFCYHSNNIVKIQYKITRVFIEHTNIHSERNHVYTWFELHTRLNELEIEPLPSYELLLNLFLRTNESI